MNCLVEPVSHVRNAIEWTNLSKMFGIFILLPSISFEGNGELKREMFHEFVAHEIQAAENVH